MFFSICLTIYISVQVENFAMSNVKIKKSLKSPKTLILVILKPEHFLAVSI